MVSLYIGKVSEMHFEKERINELNVSTDDDFITENQKGLDLDHLIGKFTLYRYG